MIVVIPNLVNDAEIAALRAIAAEGGFGSGKASTGKYLKGAKDNLEVIDSAAQTRVREIVRGHALRPPSRPCHEPAEPAALGHVDDPVPQ